jgi:hypothetical protein
MAEAGRKNLQRYLAGQRSEATQKAQTRVGAFEQSLRAEFPNPPAIVAALLESAVASFTSLILVTSKQSLGSGRIDRIERLHSLQVEVQRVLFRTVRALATYAETTDAKERSLAAIRTPETQPGPPKAVTPEEQALTERKARKEQAWREFMNRGFEGEPPRDEDY